MSQEPCQDCGNLTIVEQWRDTFKVNVCWECLKAGTSEKYKLISKTKAKEEFLVSDNDMYTLQCIEKKNPNKPEWGNMKLYLRTQVEQLSDRKYGSHEKREIARQKRQVISIERKIKSSKRLLEQEHQPPRYKIPKRAPERPKHVHRFNPDNECEECGMKVAFEEF